MVQYGFYFDQSRCIGCNACTVACKQWNQLPPGPIKWMRVYQWEKGFFPNIRLHFLAIPCYHCERPLCVKACPNNAIYKEDHYGAVLIDSSKCKGCKKCWAACPYGSIMFEKDKLGWKASKCNMCIDRLEEGKTPICVLSCSMRAIEFGPIHKLKFQFGELRSLKEMPPVNLTRPSVVFKSSNSKKQIIPWNAEKALNLWKKRGPYAPSDAPELIQEIEDLAHPPQNTIGRDHLVLKADNSIEFMYYTTDDD